MELTRFDVDPKVRNLICTLVAMVWAISVGAGIFLPDYHVDPAVNGAFAAMMGFMLTGGRDGDKGKGAGRDEA